MYVLFLSWLCITTLEAYMYVEKNEIHPSLEGVDIAWAPQRFNVRFQCHHLQLYAIFWYKIEYLII